MLASDLAALFRNALYVKHCASAAELLALPKEERDRKADMKYKRMERATLVDGEGTETKLGQ